MKKQWVSIALSLFLLSCGVGHLPSLSTKEMDSAPTVIELAKKRYTSFRASSGMAGFKSSVSRGRELASFKISTNEVRKKHSLEHFLTDMHDFCVHHNGTFEDRSSHKELLERLIQKHTRTQVTTSNLTAKFECGPHGHGTISDDWTKFNPAVCRQLANQALTKTDVRNIVDGEKVWEEFWYIPRFVCRDATKPNTAIFIGNIHERNRGSAGSFGQAIQLLVRLNQSVDPITIDDNTKVY